MNKRICDFCNLEYEIGKHNQKFCSIKCKKADYHKRTYVKNSIDGMCIECGKEFKFNEIGGMNQKFCSKKCARHNGYVRRRGELEIKNVKCEFCCKEFMPKVGNQKFCSKDCYYERTNEIFNKKCEVCGIEFITNNKIKKYCSEKCAQKKRHNTYKYNNIKIFREKSKINSKKIYEKNKNKIDFKINNTIRVSLNSIINKKQQHSSKYDIIGYNISKLKNELESNFSMGMNWNNYGSIWEIDHKIPISWFPKPKDWNDPIIKKIWAIENLRPCFIKENRTKQSSYAIIDGKRVYKKDFDISKHI